MYDNLEYRNSVIGNFKRKYISQINYKWSNQQRYKNLQY